MSDIHIIPQPVSLSPADGVFLVTPATRLVAVGDAADIAAYFRDMVAPATGFSLQIVSHRPDHGPVMEFRLDPALASLGSEGYVLSVSPSVVIARAMAAQGLRHAAQTLRQLLPAAAFDPAKVEGMAWAIPCVEIEDAPRFGWRGSMLDVARHFMPLPFIYKYLDLLAMHKMNVFHWHLTEDQGWRIEIKKYPRLTEVGAWRRETVVGHWRRDRDDMAYDGTPHGGFYSQEEARQVVAYAAARGITVVPEIEMPGHAQAAIAAYPELGNTGRQLEVSTDWGIHHEVFNAEEGTIRFLQDVLDEVLAIFPSTFIHIGGDEVPKIQWQESPSAQARMKALGLKDEAALQSYITGRMDQFLALRGRRLLGWDEILEGGLAPGATVMSWRGEAGGIAAAKAGHDVVMAPNWWTYFDYYQSEDRSREPLAIGNYLPLEKAYAFEPVPTEIDAGQAGHVLGGQCQLWTEYMPKPANVEYMAFPRLCALAEAVWTPAGQKDYSGFLARLAPHLERLRAMGVRYRPL